MAVKIQLRRGTAAQWTTANPILADGEFGFEKDTNKFKIGDGVTAWNALDYISDVTSVSGPAIDAKYANIAAMLVDQANQEEDALYFVLDASADSTVDAGWALYQKLTATTGAISDYRKLSEEESLDVIFTQPDASETVKGIAELATQAEVDAGTDDSRIVTSLKLRGQIAAASSTGVAIRFDKPRTYGLSSPETGNITFDNTGAVAGQVALIRHNHAVAPTFGSEFKKLSGSGDYVTGSINYIFCTYVSATEILYTISQIV